MRFFKLLARLVQWLQKLMQPKGSAPFFNTRENQLGMAALMGGAPMNPSEHYMYGFKGSDEIVADIIAEDERLLLELGITHEECAEMIEKIFATTGSTFCDYHIIRWACVHSPICPFGDFCTKSHFDYTPRLTEVWLCDPRYWNEVKRWYKALETNGYPTKVLKEFVDKGWIVVFSDLHPHLIREHRFFEGYQTPYRVDPRLLARLM